MIKRIVVAGCRDYDNYEEAKQYIDQCISRIRNTNKIIILSGCAKGADSIGERYALENGFEIERYPAEWKSYGKKAGPIRNKKMAEACDIVICFWDGQSRGTKSMISCAEKLGKTVYVKRV